MDTNIIYAALLGLSLAASTGLNTFLPLLMLAAAAHFKVFDVQNILNGSFAWVASGGALTALALAAVVEIVGDKIPAVDHLLDGFGTVARPAVGAFAAASVFTNADPAMAALAGLVIGAPTALGFHAAKAGTRATSSATTLGVANPILSTIEDIAAIVLTLVGLVAPVLVPVFLLLAIWIMWRLVKSARGRWPFKRHGSLPVT
jgi:uncharacterized membrane protein